MKVMVIAEFDLSKQPSFRSKSRLVAQKHDDGKIMFSLQYRDDVAEPGAWHYDEFFPWHNENFDSIIRAAHRFHHLIDRVIEYEKKTCSRSQ